MLAPRRQLARFAYMLTSAVLLFAWVKRLSSRTNAAMPMDYLLVAQKP